MNRTLFRRGVFNALTPRGWRWLGYLTLTGFGLALIGLALW